MKGAISDPEPYKPSVDGTYAIGFILVATCVKGFKLEGPKREVRTTSGNWQQPADDDDYDKDYSSNYPRKCELGNTSNIFLK